MSLTSDGRETRAQRFLVSRREFFERGDCPEDGVGSLIMRSWQRCRDRGLNHSAKGEADAAGRASLSESRERNALILEQASGVMEHVFEQIRSSGSLVILSDPEGCIIHSLGDPDFVDRANRVALQPGACWNEALRGTNAIGTAIAEKRPVEVLGLEHYLEGNGFLSCSAVPVMAADGSLCGVLDISSDHRVHQRHTLGLVKLSVQLLEKRLFESAYSGGILVAFHERPEYLGSLQEGVIALSPDGELLGANTVARDWLTARVCEGDAIGFNTIFAQGFRRIIDKASSAPSTMLKLSMRRGGDLYVQVRSMRPLVVPISRDANDDRDAGRLPRVGSDAAQPGRQTEARGARITLESLATGDPALGRALDRARRVQGKDIPLLVQGESGVGKELFAQAFHNSGPRASGPFVALNCAAVPETLIESELFGYVGGAFTGARREGAMGRIQQAHGGTLFLDEIGDMPLGMQARLLRVLQERRVTPVGSLKSIPVDIALVCATHRILSDAVANGTFREDLYYRVNSLTVCLPPLRRRTDIRVIVRRILASEAADAGGREVTIGDEVMRFFERHSWPGNIRQLQNVIRVAVALLDPDEDEILPIHLPEELFASDPADDRKMGDPVQQQPEAFPEPQAAGIAVAMVRGTRLDQVELDAINAVMREVGGNVSAAARVLGVSRNRLYRKLGRLN
ncbi:MAG: sigma-54-dependent Fis family transcriptional regulator [Zoogloeaceae bacterium]|nr:sigma-54-dependent Fis family transcriptional regulator [Zoogloeaceae bacterium]